MKKLLLLLLLPFLVIAQINPPYQWVHPKPFGTSFGAVKIWDNTTFYALGGGGTLGKTTDGGTTFNLNPFAGYPNTAPYVTTNDIYAGHYFSRDTFIVAGVYGATKTVNGGQTFTAMAPGFFTQGTIRDIQFLNQNIGFLVGTSYFKLSRTTDGGATWTTDASFPAVTQYAVHAFSPTKIFVGGTNSSGNIRFTNDGGATWTIATAGTTTIYDIDFIDTLVGFASAGSGKGYKTTDGGTTWNAMAGLVAPTSSTFYDLVLKNNKVYFVDDDSLMFVSSDTGNTFTKVRYLPVGRTNSVMRGADVSGNQIVIVGDNGTICRSTDAGVTWVSNGGNSGGSFVQGLYTSNTGKIIAVGTSPNQVMVSNDYGKTFTPVTLSVSGADLRGIQMFNDNEGYACGSGGRVWKTTDGGFNWSVYAGTTTIQAFNGISFYNQQYGMAAGNAGQIWKTVDAGNTWVTVSTGLITTGINSVAMVDSLTAFVTGSTVVGKTTDGGATWNVVTPGVPIGPISRIRMLNKSTGYIVGGAGTSAQGYVFKTTDGGATWVNKNFAFTGNMLYDIAMRNDSDLVLVGMSGGVFHTTNNGNTWRQYNLGLLNIGSTQVIGLSMLGRDTAVVGAAGGAILKVLLPAVVPVELTSFNSKVSPGKITLSWSVASELNNRGFEVEKKTAGSSIWTKIAFISGRGTSTENKVYTFEDYDVLSNSYNYRLRQIDHDGTVTVYNLPETVQYGTPDRFELAQNYPNPFNPATTINYSVPVKSVVTLKVYDILGKEVKSLVSSFHEAGSYSVEFNGSDLPSGVYLYKLTAGNYSKIMKMSLLK